MNRHAILAAASLMLTGLPRTLHVPEPSEKQPSFYPPPRANKKDGHKYLPNKKIKPRALRRMQGR